MIWIRFPADKYIAYILRSRYGNTLVKKVRKFEKTDYNLQKCKLDIVFPEMCLENKIINLKNNKFTFQDIMCLLFLSNETAKRRLLRHILNTSEKDFIVLKRKLRETLGIIDYTHVFFNKNDRKIKHQQNIHSKKLFDLGFENSQTTYCPDKVIFNY